MFSKLKQVKTLHRAALSQRRLESLLRISEDGPSVNEYNVIPAVRRWNDEKVRRPNQSSRKEYAKWESKKRKLSSLSDSESDKDDCVDNDIIDLFDD